MVGSQTWGLIYSLAHEKPNSVKEITISVIISRVSNAELSVSYNENSSLEISVLLNSAKVV